MRNQVITLVAFLILLPLFLNSQDTISSSFELRYFLNKTIADGETDFRGETEVFDTKWRLEYLKTYEKYAGKYFNNPRWDKLVISDNEIQDKLKNIKPQPNPEIRNRIWLNEWRCLGYKKGQHNESMANIKRWNTYTGVSIEDEVLIFEKMSKIKLDIPKQDWRSLFEVDVYILKNAKFEWQIEEAIKIKEDVIPKEKWTKLTVELDLESGRYNLSIDEVKVVDFKTMDNLEEVSSFSFIASKNVKLDNFHCVKYTKGLFVKNKKNTRDVPFSINTFLFEDFKLKPNIEGWEKMDYNDDIWEIRKLPFPHGGDRYKNESLYMRKIIDVGEFKEVDIYLETLDPGGEIWVNGEVIHVQKNRHPVKVKISEYLKPNEKNIIAVRVYPNMVQNTNRHTASDLYTGSFAGRCYIDLRENNYITDAFAYTKSISDSSATINISAEMTLDKYVHKEREVKKFNEFDGKLNIKLYKWFPEEDSKPAVEKDYNVKLRLFDNTRLNKELIIKDVDLWSVNSPNLYKVVCTLKDKEGHAVDDYVFTTGIRKISQDGGTFKINGIDEMMNGALLFSYKYPLKDIARTVRCSDNYWIVKQMEMMKRMNANTIRMSVHHGLKGGINDARYAEIADQMGIMFQWTTATWIRTGTPWALDFEGLPKYVKQVRNHPSIVMWQTGNHPKFYGFEKDVLPFMTKVYNTIYPIDPSRLIVPIGSNDKMGNDKYNDEGTLNLRGDTITKKTVWTAPMMSRGNFDHATGYTAKWTTLRNYPYPKNYDGDMGWRSVGFRLDYLNSKKRAYFDFESEESAGQPNWTLRKGKPEYQIKSYELNYWKEGGVGTAFTQDEWYLSQAMQGMSAYEAYRKKRWLDYDGQAWCTLHGGGNTATYMKPLIDYYGHSKIAYHTVKMAFQPILAGSKNVDMVYGKNDEIPLLVMNMGSEKEVDVIVNVKTPEGELVEQKIHRNFKLKEGRTFNDLPNWKPTFTKNGFYFFEYNVVN